ncbi:hypothetical protein SNEBB_011447 [Seison nebaliae]|nr:hypothetical protein SNEBB_011447 [Seison nebaliae]
MKFISILSSVNQFTLRHLTKMISNQIVHYNPFVSVKIAENDETKDSRPRMFMTFDYQFACDLKKTFTTYRDCSESIEKTFDRLEKKIISENKKIHMKKNRIKKKSINTINDMKIQLNLLSKDNKVIDRKSSNIDCWKENNRFLIKQFKNETTTNEVEKETLYEIKINVPTILFIKLPINLLTDIPIIPVVQSEFINEYIHELCYEWRLFHDDEFSDIISRKSQCFFYQSDLGKRVSLRVFVKLKSVDDCVDSKNELYMNELTMVSESVVEQFYEKCSISHQNFLGKEKFSHRFVSYNLLADMYTSMKGTADKIFPYCPKEFLDFTYRQSILLKELIHFQGDIYSLQEVDHAMYHDQLAPLFSGINYGSIFLPKFGVREGISMIWNKEKYELLEQTQFRISDKLSENKSDFWKEFSKILSQLDSKLIQDFFNQRAVAMIMVLRSVEDDQLFIVSNTHLYFHPSGDVIRLLQGMVILKEISDLHENYGKLSNITHFLMGDHNSCPESILTKFLTENFKEEDFLPTNFANELSEEIIEKFKFNLKNPSPSVINPYLPLTDFYLNCRMNSKDVHYEILINFPKNTTNDELSDTRECLRICEEKFQLNIQLLRIIYEQMRKINYRPKLCYERYPYTNYTEGFIHQLDYIFRNESDGIQVRSYHQPTREMIEESTSIACPNQMYPSDHLPIIEDYYLSNKIS